MPLLEKLPLLGGRLEIKMVMIMADNPQTAFADVIREVEKKRNSKIFCVVHDFDSPAHICSPEMNTILRQRDKFKNLETLEILVHTPGGHANIAYRMARFFRMNCRRLNVLVPLVAKSAGTILCLSSNSIHMGELAELGPLDVQITDELEKGKRPFSPLDEFKSMDFLREYATEFLDYFAFSLKERGMSVKQSLHEAIPAVTGMMAPLYAHIDPSKVGSYKRSLAEGEEYARRLLRSARNPNVEDVVERLVWKYPEHGFVIDRYEAAEIGLPIEPLDAIHEKQLTAAILRMISYETSFCGFIEDAPKPKRKRSKNKATKAASAGKKLPTAATGGGRTASAAAGT